MRNHRMARRVLTMALSIVLAAGVLIVGAGEAYAGGGLYENVQSITKLRGKVTFYVDRCSEMIYTFPKGSVEDVSSSNERVAYVTNFQNEGYLYIAPLEPLQKTGKATIKYTYKGKRYSVKVVVKKYSCPVESMKIGSKEYASKFKSMGGATVKRKALKGKKITVKAKKDWKVKSIVYDVSPTQLDKNGWTKVAKVKNGKKLPKAIGNHVSVVFQNKKTGGYETVRFWLK